MDTGAVVGTVDDAVVGVLWREDFVDKDPSLLVRSFKRDSSKRMRSWKTASATAENALSYPQHSKKSGNGVNLCTNRIRMLLS